MASISIVGNITLCLATPLSKEKEMKSCLGIGFALLALILILIILVTRIVIGIVDYKIETSPVGADIRFFDVQLPEGYTLVGDDGLTLFLEDEDGALFRRNPSGTLTRIEVPKGYKVLSANSDSLYLFSDQERKVLKYYHKTR